MRTKLKTTTIPTFETYLDVLKQNPSKAKKNSKA